MNLTFGERLKEEREAAGLTIARISQRLGISGKTYYNWEKDKNAMKVPTLKKIVEILHIEYEAQVGTLGFLVGLEGEE